MRQYVAKFKLLTATLLMVCLTLCSTSRASAEPPVGAGERDAANQGSGLSIADLFQKTSPAVVKILVDGESRKGIATGSGFVVAWPTPDSCEVVTNHHVIRPGVTATVEFHDGTVADVGKILAENPSADLALLQVKLRDDTKLSSHFILDVKNAAKPPIGTKLIAIGSPKGMTNTLSEGLISGYRTQDENKDWVQITNPISHGSSGGPLLTEDGRLVGITTASLKDAQNLNFAVPARDVRLLVESTKNARELWKGSCVNCEEYSVFQSLFEAKFRDFCNSHTEFAHELSRVDALSITMILGFAVNDAMAQFKDYCHEQARKDDALGLILHGWFEIQGEYPRNGKRVAEAIAMFRRALPKAPAYRHFILYAIGKAQASGVYDVNASDIVTKRVNPSLFDDAVSTLKLALEANPKFAPALHELAMVLADCRKYSDALEVNRSLLEIVPHSAKARAQRASILADAGSKLAAIEQYNIAIDLDPYDCWSFEKLGRLYTDTGQHEKAIESYKAAIDTVPRLKPGPDGVLQDAYPAYNRQSEALYLVWQIRRLMGWEYIHLTRFDEALAMFEQALQTPGVDDDPTIRPMLEQDIATCLAMRAGKR